MRCGTRGFARRRVPQRDCCRNIWRLLRRRMQMEVLGMGMGSTQLVALRFSRVHLRQHTGLHRGAHRRHQSAHTAHWIALSTSFLLVNCMSTSFLLVTSLSTSFLLVTSLSSISTSISTTLEIGAMRWTILVSISLARIFNRVTHSDWMAADKYWVLSSTRLVIFYRIT